MNQTNIWPGEFDLQSENQQSQLLNSLQEIFDSCLKEQGIEKSSFIQHDFEYVYLPLAHWLANKHKNKTLIIGLNGAQGSGKSTLAKMLSEIIIHGFNKKVLILSIDDLYKTRNERQQLAQNVHPLLATRGVPGTHDINLLTSIFIQLKNSATKVIHIPVFDKFADDRAPEAEWQRVDSPPDIIIFEGWCVGMQAESDEILLEPVNTLEKNEDANAGWRRYVNDQLKNEYRECFSNIDILLMLKIPDFGKVMEWRSLQENKLKQSVVDNVDSQNQTMNELELARFIMHFERLTRNALKYLPATADVVLELGENHQVANVLLNQK